MQEDAPGTSDLESTETVFSPGRRPGGKPPAPEPLARGVTIGRYVILDRIGGGGMGVVYTGYDPELDRKVALKLLRPDRAAGEGARLRLLREAQAIARLSHPNVVAVHDAGTFGDQVFIAMELVSGTTLKRWLDEERRPWREVMDRFLLAGRGLAAAHAAGLVHRDFKPDNVLLGEDGRVRVADFGLARAVGETGEEEPASPESGGILASPLTQLGVAVGTPAYMAPEQLRGERADARSDQFSFCVALWEALYGERPFAGVLERGPVREVPAGSRVPDRLRQALLRGLAADPAARYPAMEELLDQLGRDPESSRRRWLAAAMVVLAVGGLFAVLGYLQARRGQLCSGGETKVAGVWNAERREAGRKAFLATGLSFAPESWSRAEKALDVYLGSWAAMHRDACEATRLRGEQSEDLLDRRMFCLDQTLGEARAVTDLFARADADVVEKADDLVAKLGKVELCADTEALTARVPPPRDPALRSRVEAARIRLAAAKALSDAGKHAEALPGAREAVGAARRAGYRPLEAEALYLRAFLEDKLARSREAEATMFEAFVAAQEGGDFLAAGRASSQLAWITGSQQSRTGEGRRWFRIAQATVQGARGGAAARSEVSKQLALLLYQEGKYAEAAQVAGQALAFAERGYGAEHPQVANILSNLGIFHLMAGNKPEALAVSQRGLAIRTRALEPGHPDLAKSYNTLGNIYSDMERLDLARENYRRAFTIFRDRYGASHPMTLGVGSNLADLANKLGRYDEALQLYQDELRTAEKVYGPEHPEFARVQNDIGEVLLLKRRPGEALLRFRRALSIHEKVSGPDHPDTAFALQRIGVALADLRRPREAIAPLERSLRLREGKDVDRGLVGESRWYLAQALWDGGGDRARALRLARAAREDFQADDRPQKDVETIGAWLLERSR